MKVIVYESHPAMDQEWNGIIGELVSDRPDTEYGRDAGGWRQIVLRPDPLWLELGAEDEVRISCEHNWRGNGTVCLGGVRWREIVVDGAEGGTGE